MEITVIWNYCDIQTVGRGGDIFFSFGIEFAATIKQQHGRLAVLPALPGAVFLAPVLLSDLISRGCHSC
jgi:hypothetical protein